MRFIRYLTATSTLVVMAFLTLVLAFYSLSVAIGAEQSNRVGERDCIAEAPCTILQRVALTYTRLRGGALV
jgi:hypothetical protein